jgi:hypothetical protein
MLKALGRGWMGDGELGKCLTGNYHPESTSLKELAHQQFSPHKIHQQANIIDNHKEF